jgi:ribonuclease VapC
MMAVVIDTSVLVEIVLRQPGREKALSILSGTGQIYLSTVSLYEASIVLLGRFGPRGVTLLRQLVDALQTIVVPFDEEQSRLALDAYSRFGKGRHPAALNFGDCPVYALAQTKNAPVLFKGNDFKNTDLPILASLD